MPHHTLAFRAIGRRLLDTGPAANLLGLSYPVSSGIVSQGLDASEILKAANQSLAAYHCACPSRDSFSFLWGFIPCFEGSAFFGQGADSGASIRGPTPSFPTTSITWRGNAKQRQDMGLHYRLFAAFLN